MERFGEYLLIRDLAKGRITTVYKAKPVGVRGFTGTVALHRVRPPFSENRRFLKVLSDQAHLASALDHPKVVRILEHDLTGAQPYLVTEYLPGRDLLDLMVRCASMHRRLPLSTACRIAIEALEGLSAAHRFEGLGDRPRAILHGGLTPGCVLLGFNGQVQIAGFGFGLAIAVARAQARDLHVLQAAYSSPEVARRERVTPTSDLFSLGLILAELLTLRPMYPRKDPAELEQRICACRWERQHLEPLPGPLRGFLEKLLAEAPAARYPSAMAARTALLEVLGVSAGDASRTTLAAAARALFATELEAEEQENRELEEALAGQVEHCPANVSDDPQQVEVDVLPLSAVAPAHTSGPLDLEPEATSVIEVVLPVAGHSEKLREVSEVSWAEVAVPEFVTDPDGVVRQIEPSEIRRDLEAGRRRPQPPPPPPDALEDDETIEPTPTPRPRPAPAAPGSAGRPASAAAATAEPSAPTLSGDLARRSLAGLLYRLATDDRSGRLELRRDPRVKSLFIKAGRVEYVRSNVESEYLGEFLVRRGAMTRTYLDKALGDAAVRRCTFSELLLAEKIMSAHDLAQMMTEQNRERVLSCFEWTAGRFAFFEDEQVQEKRVPLKLDLIELITEGVRKRVPGVIIESALKADWLQVPVMTRRLPAAISFSAAEQRILQAIDGKQMLQDVVMTAGGDSEEIVRVIYLLQELGCLRFRQRPPPGA